MQTKLNEVFLLQILSRQRQLRPLPRDWGPDEVNKSRDSKGSRNHRRLYVYGAKPYRNSDVTSESAQNTLAAGCDWLVEEAESRLIGRERRATVNDHGQQQYPSRNEIIHTVVIATTGLETCRSREDNHFD